MKKSLIRVLFTFLLLFFFTGVSTAQLNRDTSTIWQIETKDGNRFVGKIMTRTKDNIFLKTESLGTIAIKRKLIRSRNIFEKGTQASATSSLRKNILSKYMLGPNGILQPEDQGYFESRYIFINHVNLALSDGFSLGVGGMPFLPVLFTESGFPLWVAPKFKIPTGQDKLHIAAGGYFASILFNEYGDGNIAIGYLVGTYGTEVFNFTAGVAYGYFDYMWMDDPTFVFSGSARLSKNFYMYLENFVVQPFTYDRFSDPELLYSIGSRKLLRRSILEFGIMIPRNKGDQFINAIIPYLGFVKPFR